MEEGPSIRVLRRPPRALRERLNARLTAFNRQRVGRSGAGTFAAVISDPASGRELAGLWAENYWGWMYVDQLWVDGRHRGRGFGRRLMAAAEAEARARNCHGLWLDTWSWQAQGFYEKLGFTVFGMLEDFPPPHRRLFLRKRFAPPEPPGP